MEAEFMDSPRKCNLFFYFFCVAGNFPDAYTFIHTGEPRKSRGGCARLDGRGFFKFKTDTTCNTDSTTAENF
ncbi:MAG: hypothetical protein DBY30_03960 [Verrucomicrobia bacterium]|nr:MAG: hypothetical protein DBY30_03960 [Verrucomicrobiota bacterium]